jgi:hypothetical protein
MRLAKIFPIIALVVILAIESVFSGGNSQQTVKSLDRSTDRWVEHNYKAVLKTLLPGGATASGRYPKNVKWMVTVRILPPYEIPEYYFSLHRTYDNKIEAVVTMAKRASIFSQLRALRNRHPDATLQKIADLVSIERRAITQLDCPQLSQLVNQFEAISISPVLPDDLYVDETGYEIWSQSLYGNKMEMILSGPGPKAEKQSHPLLQWAEAARRVLDSCLKK